MRCFSRPVKPAMVLPVLLFLCFLSVEGYGQFKEAPGVVLRGGRIIPVTGEIIEEGTILIRKDKIAEVGKEVEIPEGVNPIDVEGMTIIPGLIDAWGKLEKGSTSQALAFASMADEVDPYNASAWREVLENGVTAVYLGTGQASPFNGQGAVLRLMPGAPPADLFLKREAGLCCALGIGRAQDFFARIVELQALEKIIKQAKTYQESWEIYEEELAEYVKKIEERKKKKEDAEKEKGKEKPKKEGEKPGEEKKKEEGEEKREKNEGNGERRFLAEEEKGEVKEEKKEGEKKEEEKKEEEKKEELKKPKRPAFNAHLHVICKALKGEIPVRMEVHRASEILNVLDLVKKYPMDLALEGCTEGYLVADAIAKAEVPVILGSTLRSGLYEANPFSRHNPQNGAILKKAGVKVVLGSGGTLGGGSRFLAFNAALAASHGLPVKDALEGITRSAAEVLGISHRVGTLEKGKDADIVILDGCPFSSRTKVHSVYVAGKRVYPQKAQ